MKNILLIAYKFPPFKGVASRRWAKFSRVLAESGHKVFVVTTYWPENTNLTWKHDVTHKNINIIKTKSFGFHLFINKSFDNYMVKVVQSIIKKLLSYIYFIDETQFWNLSLLPTCKSIISSHKIDMIIATGQPFMVNYHASKLKKKFPQIPLVNDFRDAWNEGPIKKYRLFRSIGLGYQLKALMKADIISVVSEGMKNNLLNFCPKIPPNKIKAIYNGYNESDFLNTSIRKQNKLFKIIYAGGLGFGRIDGLILLLDTLTRLISTDQIKADNIQFSYFGNYATIIPDNYKHLKWFHIMQTVSPLQVMEETQQSDLITIFNSKIFNYAISSKLFESIRSGIPTLAITPLGDISSIAKLFPDHLYSVDYNESDKLSIILTDLIHNHFHSKKNRVLLPKNINEFSNSSQMKKLLKCIE